jgi:hypothetical protein
MDEYCTRNYGRNYGYLGLLTNPFLGAKEVTIRTTFKCVHGYLSNNTGNQNIWQHVMITKSSI